MSARLNMFDAAPEMVAAMTALETAVANSGLDETIYHLVKLRASQINGCAFCIHMHTREARLHGEREDRLHMVVAWWESSVFTDRERAALQWTDSLTLIAQTRVPDADFAAVKAQFTDAEIVKLTVLIGAINTWNRMAVAFRSQHPRSWSIEPKAAA